MCAGKRRSPRRVVLWLKLIVANARDRCRVPVRRARFAWLRRSLSGTDRRMESVHGYGARTYVRAAGIVAYSRWIVDQVVGTGRVNIETEAFEFVDELEAYSRLPRSEVA